MYDDWHDPTPFPASPIELDQRVTHLVYVGGRLVETWHERAAATEWASYVERPVPPPPPPVPPAHERALDWLADVCGGRAAVDALDVAPLTAETPMPPPEFPDRAAEERSAAAADLLDHLADRWFDEETGHAFRAALVALWHEDPVLARRAATPAHLAGGVCWAVGKANGLFHPAGVRRVGTVQDTLGLPSGLSNRGNEVAAALRGFRAWRTEWRRPAGVPDLLPLGRSDVLLAATREQLVRLRDKAVAAA